MDMTGEYRIPAPRETVWRALNDPEVLKRCIPGCEDLQKTSDTEMTARVSTKVGPVSAKFSGKVTLSDINPPESYRISGEGQGGVAGFAKGGAEVRLSEDGSAATVLNYKATAQVGGKLAQIGSRLIDSTAKKMADQFFGKFAEEVGGPQPTVAVEAAATVPGSAAAAPPPETGPQPGGVPGAEAIKPPPGREPTPTAGPAPSSGGMKPAIWIGGLIAIVVILLVIFAL